MDACKLTEDEEADLNAWLAEDSRCLGALARARALAVSSEVTEALGRRPAPALWRLPSMPVDRRVFLAAIPMAVAGLAALVFLRRETVSRVPYESLMGEVRKIPLPDGSHITLNTNSAITVEFSQKRRLVRLLRGEAYFEVAKNPDRPFVVEGPFAQVRTVGTAYTVRLMEAHAASAMRVQVTSGRVAIESPPSQLARTLQSAGVLPLALSKARGGVFVNADQEASLQLSGDREVLVSVHAQPAENLARALMWREGQLSFAGESLAEAVAEFARYSPQRIVIADGELGRMHIVGLFSVTNPENFARAAALSLRANISKENGNIVLYK